MRIVYVIGAQCTGKTTLVDAVGAWFQQNMPEVVFASIQETARSILRSHHFTRDDVRAGGERCLQLQKSILQSQADAERGFENVDLVISDRSGIDPLVYARMYCGEEAAQEMIQSHAWTEIVSRMKEEVVIVCEPVEGWLFDDGTRLMPEDQEEWMATHRLFCEILRRHQVPYVVLAASVTETSERVSFVLSMARGMKTKAMN